MVQKICKVYWRVVIGENTIPVYQLSHAGIQTREALMSCLENIWCLETSESNK